MKNPANKQTVIIALALATTVLVAVPLISGAAPLSAPPTGSVVPNFSGLKILDGSNQLSLDVNGYGLITSPQAGTPVTVKDTDGLKVFGEGMNANYLNFNPATGINAGNIDAGIQVPLKLNDIVEFFDELRSGTASALKIRHDNGIEFTKGNLPTQTTNLKIGSNADLTNPGTLNNGNVYVGDGFEVNSTANVTPPASWIAAGGGTPVNSTTLKAASGIFDVQRVFKQFSPVRIFISDKFSLDNTGSKWETTYSPTCDPDDGCGWPAISRIIQGTRSAAMTLASDHGVSLGYLDDGSFGPLHGFIDLLNIQAGGNGDKGFVDIKGKIYNEDFWQPPAGDTDMTSHRIKCEQIDKGTFNMATRECALPVRVSDNEGLSVSGKLNTGSMASTGTIYSAGTISAAGKITAGGGFGSYYVKDGTNTTIPANSSGAVTVSCNDVNDIAVSCGYYKQWDEDLHIYSVAPNSGNSCSVSARNWNPTTGKWFWPKVKCFTPGS
jgi:hypothetical protein